MIIEIKGAEFVNKGAELMLHSIMQKVGCSIKDVKFTLVPYESCPYEKYARLGIYPKASFQRFNIQLGNLLKFAPSKIRKSLGIILESEVNAVLDSSGFAYSDQWKIANTRLMALSTKNWKKQGKKVVFLPQAFGPFSSPEIKSYIKTMVNNSDLMFARDKISYKHITEITGEVPNVRIAPDFTNLTGGIVPEYFKSDKNDRRICIIPNYRMIDKLSGSNEVYVRFLVNSVKYLLERSCKPFILIHEQNKDLEIAKEIVRNTGNSLEIISEENPLHIKGIIGASYAVISSRFHGLVSALSQGVPSIATGWSHKYQMLLEDYHFSEGLSLLDEPIEDTQAKLDLISREEKREKAAETIRESSKIQKALSLNMWDNVLKTLQS